MAPISTSQPVVSPRAFIVGASLDDARAPASGAPTYANAWFADVRLRPASGAARATALHFSNRAFTLLELLAVIAIIAVLSGLVLGIGRRANEAGRIARTKAELASLSAALEHYQRAFGDYPQTDDPARLLQSLIGKRDPLGVTIAARALLETAGFTTAETRDPFTDTTAVLLDPWGRPYRYAFKSPLPWSNPSYVLWSTGPDGRDSGNLIAGGFPDPVWVENMDNIYANR